MRENHVKSKPGGGGGVVNNETYLTPLWHFLMRAKLLNVPPNCENIV